MMSNLDPHPPRAQPPIDHLPPLPLDDWEPVKQTLHRWIQIVGKIRLRTAPPRNHWWHVPLYVTARGLTTSPMPRNGGTFTIDFDFIDHAVMIATNAGDQERFALEDGLSVARFYELLFTRLRRLGIEVEILGKPFDLQPNVPFAADTEHASYDPDAVHRWWHILAWTAPIFETANGDFLGKTSPVHLFWHSFDLAVTRFSGRAAPPMPEADPVTREAYSHEVISFGFWPGDANVRSPAYYAYVAPEPSRLTDQPLRPESASWIDTGRGNQALLMYDDLRAQPDPRAALLDFMNSVYRAGAATATWDPALVR